MFHSAETSSYYNWKKKKKIGFGDSTLLTSWLHKLLVVSFVGLLCCASLAKAEKNKHCKSQFTYSFDTVCIVKWILLVSHLNKHIRWLWLSKNGKLFTKGQHTTNFKEMHSHLFYFHTSRCISPFCSYVHIKANNILWVSVWWCRHRRCIHNVSLPFSVIPYTCFVRHVYSRSSRPIDSSSLSLSLSLDARLFFFYSLSFLSVFLKERIKPV